MVLDVLEVGGDEMCVVSAEIVEEDWDFECLVLAKIAV